MSKLFKEKLTKQFGGLVNKHIIEYFFYILAAFLLFYKSLHLVRVMTKMPYEWRFFIWEFVSTSKT